MAAARVPLDLSTSCSGALGEVDNEGVRRPVSPRARGSPQPRA